MAYIPHTEANRQAMLEAIGVRRIEDLFRDVPERVRFPELDLPEPAAEMEVLADMRALAESNVTCQQTACFLGAGAYHHYIPSVVGHLTLRGEFLTSYTPYQPEISQGTLQAIFEFQSMVAALTGMQVANASHYDGATALAEAVILALHHARGQRRRVILSPGIHPDYRAVVRTYAQGMQLDIVGDEDLAATSEDALRHLNDRTALFAVQYPNFLGAIEPVADLAERAHAAGALVCVVANPLALGLLKPPGELGADVVVGEAQPLGIPLSFGGPTCGFFAAREEYVRKMSGRLVGETVDRLGRRGYVLTLTPREQHIRREKASSNVCTNSGLMMLSAAIYLSAMGRCGLRQVAELCYHKAHYAAERLSALPGYAVLSDRPFFNEFVLKCPAPVSEINRQLLDDYDILGGYDLGQAVPHLAQHMLLAVTEMNTREQVDTLIEALRSIED